MPDVRAERLKVPGARLYYEARGSGPLLLLIPGGPADAGVFSGIVDFLANLYTVVAYDPRGNSRSLLDGPPEDQSMDVHGDDAAWLLASLDNGRPPYAFGASGGAQIGLNLAARYPDRLHTLIAHEPPCLDLLPDAAEQRAMMEQIRTTYLRDGVGPALKTFLTATGMERGPQSIRHVSQSQSFREVQDTERRIERNLDYFFAHGLMPISSYVPDIAALCSGPARVLVGVGETSGGQLAHRSAIALTGQLGIAPMFFPGGHDSYKAQPPAFTERLFHTLLSVSSPSEPEGK